MPLTCIHKICRREIEGGRRRETCTAPTHEQVCSHCNKPGCKPICQCCNRASDALDVHRENLKCAIQKNQRTLRKQSMNNFSPSLNTLINFISWHSDCSSITFDNQNWISIMDGGVKGKIIALLYKLMVENHIMHGCTCMLKHIPLWWTWIWVTCTRHKWFFD